jgi:dTDP-4-dehydrorhamnose 3,5-epimerase
MFQEGPIDGVILRPLARHGDARGWLIELVREDELPPEHRPAMTYLSMTLPGVARGPHEHRQQADLFAFVGPGDFKLYLWDNRRDSPTYRNKQALVVGESNRQAVLVPPGVVHAYRNLSDVPAVVFNAPNRLYAGWGRSEPVDEIRHENVPDSPYRLD